MAGKVAGRVKRDGVVERLQGDRMSAMEDSGRLEG